MADATPPTIDWADVQGMVLKGYGKHAFSASLLIKFDDGDKARAWLAAAIARITTAEQAKARGDEAYLNLAIAHGGMTKLGFTEDVLATFPTAFLDGMDSANRSRILGDNPPSDPGHWNWGGPDVPVDAILLIFAKTEAGRDAAVSSETAALSGITLAIAPILTQLNPDQKEHFGFHDGVSQPVIEGSPVLPNKPAPPAMKNYDANVIKAGEFLLGYNNEYGVLPDLVDLPPAWDAGGVLPTALLPDGSKAPDLGKNGTYLVVRQVAQDVARLWSYLDGATKNAAGQSQPEQQALLGGKLIGRWPSGAPMALAPNQDNPALADENDFVYETIDPQGLGCPFGSHTRRANPRDTLGDDPTEALNLTKRHRLIRRARSYGPRAATPPDPNDTTERGLLFMCVNANIERQFEFVQQTWLDNPSFNGLYDERDPIFGQDGGAAIGTMTIPRTPVRRRLEGLGGFVTIRGGAYFFLPSLTALRYLAAARPPTVT